jgi:hypothetical protein
LTLSCGVCTLWCMQYRTDREEWAIAAQRAGLRLETIAHFLDTTYPTVYAYAVGRRTPSPEWLGRVYALIAHPEWVDTANECYDRARAA